MEYPNPILKFLYAPLKIAFLSSSLCSPDEGTQPHLCFNTSVFKEDKEVNRMEKLSSGL
jgi:hypothetical protein